MLFVFVRSAWQTETTFIRWPCCLTARLQVSWCPAPGWLAAIGTARG